MCSKPEGIFPLNHPSTKRSKNSQVVQNQKEQTFLNITIIITCITIVTVTPGSVNDKRFKAARCKNVVFRAVAMAILSLNFAFGPFVYFILPERYWKTFKLMYGYKR
jgi:hypothetical protein